MNAHPFLDGIRQGIVAGLFDTNAEVSPMKSKPNFNALATRYQVSSRTIYRWHESGIDVFDELELATYLTSLRNPSTEALLALEKLLTIELKNHE